MKPKVSRPILKDKKALVVGIANEHSIAYGCAKAFRELDAELAITFLNEKAKPHVELLANELDAAIFMPGKTLGEEEQYRLTKLKQLFTPSNGQPTKA